MSGFTTSDWPPPVPTAATALFGIRYPVIQAGMVWAAGWKLAVAVSGAGGLGVIGAGSMSPDLLREHIRKAKAAARGSFGVNIPLSRGDAEDLVRATVDEGVRIVFMSSGHPVRFTGRLKEAGCVVIHVIAAVKHGLKAEEAGCDAVVVEGFEAGGHNGVDELTTLALVPQVVDAVKLPVIAAGGIADGRGLAAVLALGAQAAQVGTRFAATIEASSHETYKNAIVAARDTDTVLTMKQVVPVRMLKTPFARRVVEAERGGADRLAMLALLGERRERRGIFEGDLQEGMFEAGQGAGLVREILPASEVVRRMMAEYHAVKGKMP
jgi:enoyl-[acyl-carrier protein] reductase II